MGRLLPAAGRRRAWRAWRRAVAGRPRLLALSATTAAFAAGAHLAPAFIAPLGEQVVVAAADLPAGHRVQDGDLTVTRWPTGARPNGVLPHPQGRVLAAPVRRGEPLTDVRMVDGDLLRGLPGRLRAVPVRLVDAPAALLRPGRHVDILAGRTEAGPDGDNGAITGPDDALASVVVADALLLTVPSGEPTDADPPAVSAGPGTATDTVVVLAVDDTGAARLAAVAGRPLTVALRS